MSDKEQQDGFILYAKSPSGIEVAIGLTLAGIDDPADIALFCRNVDAELKKAGFTRSDRLDRPVYQGAGGGRNQRPEIPPPAGIVRWEHCSVPAKYIVYKKDGAKGFPERGVEPGKADMWVCAKDKQCEDVTSGKSDRAAAHFDMKKVAAKPNASVDGDRPMTAEEKQQFWQATRDMGYTRDQVFEHAADVIDGKGPAMKDTEFTKLCDKSKLGVHRIFTRLKELHEAGGA